MTRESFEGAVREDTVLVVDDEEDIRDSVGQLLSLSLQDVEVVTAISADEGLRCLEGGGIDLIISDYRMPDKDGLEMLREAARIAPDVPRILMTAFGDMDIALKAINEAHVTNFFSKPFDPDVVTDTVWSLLDARWESLQHMERSTHSVASVWGMDLDNPPHHRDRRR